MDYQSVFAKMHQFDMMMARMQSFSSCRKTISHEDCARKASIIHSSLVENQISGIHQIKPFEGFCFQIIFDNAIDHSIAGMSISVPPMGYEIFEIALINNTGNLIYISEFGYSDIQQFETVDEIRDEIQRVITLLANC
jgi:hypothetical protein